MAFTKYLLPVLAITGAAIAQGLCPETDTAGVYTIQNQGDAGALQNCRDFDGTIVIAPQTVGEIKLNGVQSISGNLSAFNASGLTDISSDQLNRIGGYFVLRDIQILQNLQMTSLSEVDVINFEALPNLQTLNFATGVQKATGVRIVNTGLASLAGIELTRVSALEVTNNNDLAEFNVNNLGSISSYLTVAANGLSLNIELPNLLTAANLTFRNISSLDVPSLANVTGSFGCYSNSFDSFSAPNLTLVGNALVFNDNSELTNISIPGLLTVGGSYQIANNTELKVIDGFTKLKTVGGALDFSGSFTNVSLPALADVKGGFNMQSIEEFDCSAFESKKKSVIKGTFKCDGGLDEATTKDGDTSATGNGKGKKKNAASPLEINMVTSSFLGALVVAFVL